jgi:DNA polymerase III epsilon subunit-like protein
MDEHLLRFDTTKTLVFIDFETENLNLYLENNLPWQAAMLRVNGNEIGAQYDRYLKWHRPLNVSQGAAIATRFDGPKVERLSVPAKEVMETVVLWTSQADYIIGHNILGFDLAFIFEFYKRCGVSTKGLTAKVIDTHPLSKGLKLNDLFDRKKSSLLEYQYRLIHTFAKGVKTNSLHLGRDVYQIPHDYEHLHDALVDLQLLFKIWNKVKYQVEI